MLKTAVQPKRLCIVTHQCRKNDGQGRVNYEIAKSAVEAGWYVTFLGTELADDLEKHPQVTWLKIQPSRLPSTLLRYQVFAWKSASLLRSHRANFDIIHANGFITWHDADVNTAHFVHSGWLNCGYYPYHWLQSPYGAYQRLVTGLNAKFERTAFRRAHKVVAVSNKIASELAAIGVPATNISTIHNGVDLDEFRPGATERERFKLPPAVPLFLFAGDIRTARKNLATVLQAMVLAPVCHLAVAGRLEGSPYPALAQELGIANRVHFLDMISDIPSLMRSVDSFVFPSRYEAMSLVLLEAMASGLPVITAISAGGAELVGDGGRVLNDPDDAQTLAAWMTEFASNPAIRIDMGAKARSVAEKYSWRVMTRQYLDLYETLTASSVA